jgi:hypothetical protein
LFFGLDLLGGELRQLEEIDAAVVDQRAALGITHPVTVDVARDVGQQRLAEQPDGERRLERAVVVAAGELAAIDVRPAVEDARRQLGQDQELDLDLKDTSALVACLDVDDAQLVVQELLFIVGVEDADLDHRGRQLVAEHGVEEMHQQVLVLLVAEQGLEDAVDLWVDGVAHAGSIARRGATR